ncbi:zincin-like metallopeptidase toxin domain-containing protein [Flavobacterium sp.]|uniref:zincin-like metallopeptidase toxin domain-containing protein n=1 Tax=Flavobacterium sp. TaxID=239 RepID=UPI003D6B058B
MSTYNGIPIVFDDGDTNLLGSLFPQGMRGEQSSGGNNFPQFPIPVQFTSLSPKDIGNKYYKNNTVYEQNGVKVYADEGITFEKELEEVKIYGNRFYKEFKDFTFVLFASKNGALLLNQYKECIVSGNEIALFLEIDDPTNFLGSVMQIKVGTGIDKIKLPIAEMLDFMRTKRVNLESKDIIKLIKGKYQSKESILSWIGEMFTKIIGGITSFILTSAGTLNQAFISAFDALLIGDNRWNTEAEGYNAFFIPDAVSDLLNSADNDDKIAEAIVSPIITTLGTIEKAVDLSIGLLKPILPSQIYAEVKKKIKQLFLEIDGFLEHVKGVSFLELLKTAAEVANAHLCGFINGIVEFFKGFFEIIGMILNLANAQADYAKDPFLYNSLLAEMFENLMEMIIGFDFKKFIVNAFVYPLNLLVKTIKFVKSLNVDVTSLDINLSKVGYLCGYIKGLIVSIIVDAFLTGGIKAVEDILKALGTFLKNPKGILKDAMKTAGRKTAASVETVIDFMATMASKIKKGATKLFEDFEKFVDDIFKWLEELFGVRNANDKTQIDKRFEDFLEKWKGKKISGKGFLGSPTLSRKEIQAWQEFLLKEFKTELRILEKNKKMLQAFDDLGIQAAFDPIENVIWMRKDTTHFELLHESKHSQECFLIGKEEYLKGRKDFGGSPTDILIRTYKREKYVYDELMKQKKNLSQAEIKYSEWYMQDRVIKKCKEQLIDIDNIK